MSIYLLYLIGLIYLEDSNTSQFTHSVMSDSATPWTAACQTSLTITNSQSLLKLMSMEPVMSSQHLIFCHALFLLPSIFPSIGIRVFSSKSVFCMGVCILIL